MILTYVLPLLMAFTPSSTSDSFYKYTGQLNSTEYIPSVPIPADNNKTYYIESFISTRQQVAYDDNFSWRVSDFEFMIYATAYYVPSSSGYNSPVVDSSAYLYVNMPFSFTPSSYQSELDNIVIQVGLDSNDDRIYIQFDFTGNDYYETVHKYAESSELDDTWSDSPSSYMETRLNNNNYFSQVNYYTRLTTDDYSNEAYNDGYAHGYTDGYNHGMEVDGTAVTILNGILNIALVPINFFLGIFNFEILGINVSQLVSALLSICLVIIVVRMVTGKSQGGGD